MPDGSKVKIPVPSSVTKSLAAYMKTPEKAKAVSYTHLTLPTKLEV